MTNVCPPCRLAAAEALKDFVEVLFKAINDDWAERFRSARKFVSGAIDSELAEAFGDSGGIKFFRRRIFDLSEGCGGVPVMAGKAVDRQLSQAGV